MDQSVSNKAIRVLNWANEPKVAETLSDMDIEVGVVLNGTVKDAFALAKGIFDTGLNVMLSYGSENSTINISVDSKRFSNR